MFAGRYLWWMLTGIILLIFSAICLDHLTWLVLQLSHCVEMAGSCMPVVRFMGGTLKTALAWIAIGILFGYLLSFGGTYVLETLMQLKGSRAIVSLGSLILATGVAAGVGVFFGFFPALLLSIPAFIVMAEKIPTPWKTFFGGWAFGAGYFIFGFYWISAALFVDIKQWIWVLPFSLIGGPGLMGIYWGFAAAAVFRQHPNERRP